MEYQEIVDRLKHIVNTPTHPIPEETLSKIRERYYAKHAKSAALYEKAKEVIPGGVEHNLSLEKPFPITMDRAKGYKMWDIDGNEYVDYLMSGAPIILGHHFDPLDDKIIALIKEKGPSTGCTSEYEILAAQEIVKHVPNVEMVRFLQSGTESVMAALRIARIYTQKDKIIKIGGSYHGWSDQVVYSLHVPGAGPLESAGIPSDCFNNLVDVFPNDFEGLKRAFEENKDKGGIAAVIVEPVGGESGTHPVHPEWNKTIRRLCDEYGALLIFDEVVTGFRLDLGGAQKYLNINADIVVFGKIIAHGYPAAGGIGGRKDIMNICSGVGSIGQKAYVGGTLSANPISTAACYYAIKLIEENNAIQKATEYADKLTKAMNDLFSTRKDLPFFAYNFGPIIHYETTGMLAVSVDHPDVLNEVMTRRHIAQDYQMVIIDQGIFTLAGSRMYTCMQHDKEALDKTIKAWEYTLSLIPKG